MGVISMFSSCRCSYQAPQQQQPRLPNPDPTNFNINNVREVGRFLIVMVTYPDCTNYEGRKILVYENATQNQLFQSQELDPHFCNNPTCKSPIARFEPTKRGWEMALTFVIEWMKKDG